MTVRLFCLSAVLLFFSLISAFCQEIGSAKSALFVSTIPIRADVYLDGEKQEGHTPLIINAAPGVHEVEVRKASYIPQKIQIDFPEDAVEMITFNLAEVYTHSQFPREETVVVNGEALPAGEHYILLPNGRYNIRRQGELIHIKPIYPAEELLTVLDVLMPISLVASGALTILEFGSDTSSQYPISPLLITSYAATLSLIGFDIALRNERNRFYESFPAAAVAPETAVGEAADIYDEGETLLSLGRLTEAQERYTKIMMDYPDSFFFPLSVYKSARIHTINGNAFLAENSFRFIVEKYPYHEVYDKACKHLADLLYNKGDYRTSIEYLDKMYLIDPLYNREEIDVYKCEILETAAADESDRYSGCRRCYQAMRESYPDSPHIDRYTVKAAYYYYLEGNTAAARRLIKEIDPDNREIREQVEEFMRREGIPLKGAGF
jgi:tetratricopeptide (TPR) repeat protein